MQKPYVIGITGGSGSGKTFFVEELSQTLATEDYCIFSQDNYYVPIAEQPRDAKGIENFDTLHSIDLEHYRQDLEKLLKGESIQIKEYTFNNPDKSEKILTLHSASLIFIEGIFIFNEKSLTDLIDLKIFVDVNEATRLSRRIIRDSQERGYDLNDVLYRYEVHHYPAYKHHIEPFKDQADLIIPNYSDFSKVIEILLPFLQKKLDNSIIPK